MVKYAIVDSGLNNIYVTEQIIGGISFRIGCDGEIKMQDEFEDDNGHGTMVFQIIREKSNPEDEFYIVKVLEENNKGSSSVLYEALKWLLDIDVKYIVICIATENAGVADKYQGIVDKLVDQGKVIFSSWANNPECRYSYPAILNNVISVGRDRLVNQKIEYNFNRKVQCIIDVDPAYIWIPDRGFQVFGGNSQAAAEFVAITSKRVGNVKNVTDYMEKVIFYNERKVESKRYGKSVNGYILELLKKNTDNISGDVPLWKIFPSIKEFSLFLESVCDKFLIDRKLVVFRRSMFSNLLIFSESIEQMKNYK